VGLGAQIGLIMVEILLFIKDFEFGSKVSSSCVDQEKNVEFSDENSKPDSFPKSVKMAIVDMDEEVFASIGLVAELKRLNIAVIGTKKVISNKEQSKIKSVGCDMLLPKSSLVKNIPSLIDQLL
jgi:hypothetical protein|tara:strand:- start:845 stop:1216 length:372 start_codon:yes stop_codon:yes gene_type:complete